MVLSRLSSVLAILWLASVVQALSLSWPNYPEAGVDFTIRWSGGTPPYLLYALDSAETAYFWSWSGSAVQTSWNFAVPVGTGVRFQLKDSVGNNIYSSLVSVIADTDLHFPLTVVQNVASSVTWTGGLAPYTCTVVSPDNSITYYQYKGSGSSSSFPMAIAPGTAIKFQLVDANGVTASSSTIYVSQGVNPTQSILSVQSIQSIQSVSIQSVQSLQSVAAAAATASIESVLSLQSLASLYAISVESVASLASIASTSSIAVQATLTTPSATPTTPTSPPDSATLPNTPTSTSAGASSPNPSATPSPTTGVPHPSSNAKKSDTAAIAAGVLGGVIGLILIILLGRCLVRRGRAHADEPDGRITASGGELGDGMGAYESKAVPTVPDADGPLEKELLQHLGIHQPQGFPPSGVGASGEYAQSFVTAGAAGVGAGAAAANAGASYYNQQGQQGRVQYPNLDSGSPYGGMQAPSEISSGYTAVAGGHDQMGNQGAHSGSTSPIHGGRGATLERTMSSAAGFKGLPEVYNAK